MTPKDTLEQASDVTIASMASKMTYTSAGSIGFGWALSSEAAVFFGILGVAAGNIINWWFKRKADKREEEIHRLKVHEYATRFLDES